MNKLLKLCLVLLSSSAIISCSKKDDSSNSGGNTSNTTNTTSERYSESQLKELESKYGKLQITREDNLSVNYTYDESKNEYRIAIEETKAKYVITGYTTAHFVITNTNNLATHKGIKLKLNNACIISSGEYVPIYYSLSAKNIEISAKNDTNNIIATLNGSNAIDSENNIELGGNGSLDIYTKKTNSYGSNGHCIKSANKVLIYDSINLNLESAHDGINCDELITMNEDDNTIYTGKVNFKNIVSQAVEGTTKKCGGSINIYGGSFTIDGAQTIFKTDYELKIHSDASVVGTNIRGEPILKQTSEEVEANITIPVLDIVVEGTFTSNGTKIESKKM